MEISNSLLEYLSRVLKNQNNRNMHISSLSNHTNSLKPKQKKYIKRMGGWKKFITSHPNEFALVDDRVILLQDPIPRAVRQAQSSSAKRSSATNSDDKFTPPSKTTVAKIKQDIKESNSCVVCSDPMDVFAIGACFHPICYKCSTKLRVLCQDKQCPWCRMSLTKVYFTRTLAPESELTTSSFIKEQKYGIFFENQQIRNMHKVLLEHKCRKPNCGVKYDDFDDLRTHMQKKHGEYFCDLCVLQCKIFTHERETYSTMELRDHEGDGDANSPSASKGHPLCPFCNSRYLDRDELLRHLQQHHCSCHLCFDQSHVFYADIDELWADHHFKCHFACRESECHGLMKTVFKTEEELKKHVSERHSWHRPSAGKRSEQHVALDVKFGSPRAGLQFGNEQPSGYRLTSISGSSMAFSADGHLRCTGTVINVSFFWGFIQRDDCRGVFQENIFFDKRSCEVESEEDLKNYFKMGDRVVVHAVKADRSHRSKWRAIDVTKIEESEIDRLSIRTRTYSDSSFVTVDDVESVSAEILNTDSYFPALPTNSGDSASGAIPASGATNWSTVVKSKKAVTKPAAKIASKVASSPKKITPNKEKKVERNGVGTVVNVEPLYGFITQPHNTFEDNIYFNLQSYRYGSENTSISDLTKQLKHGDKICYVLEEPGFNKRNAKSKYRAKSVWKFSAKKEVKTSPQTSGSASNAIPGSQLSTETSASKTAKGKVASTPIAAPTGKKKKSKDKENIAPTGNKTDSNSKANQSHKKEITEKLDPPLDFLNGLMELDTFETTLIANNSEVKRSLSSDVEEIFRALLVDITGDGGGDVLFDFDTELAINEIKLSQIAFIRFSKNESPKIHSILLPSNNGHSNGFRHRQFSLNDVSGFNEKAIKTLSDKGTLLVNDDTLYYVNKSNFYITLRKDESGTPVQLFLHTPFNAAYITS